MRNVSIGAPEPGRMDSSGDRNGFRRWAASALAALSLVYLAGAVFDPPFLRPLMKLSCHRIPGRSFYFPWGTGGQCARCTGFWAGGFVSAVMLFVKRVPGTILCGFLLLMPMLVDGSLQYIGLYESSNVPRVITGALAGAGLAMLLGRAADDG